MARSKSPARSAAAKSSDPLQDPHVQLAVAVAMIGGLVQLSGGNAVDPKAWSNFFNQEKASSVHETYLPFGWILFLHALNTAKNADGSYWLNSFINTFVATFACNIANTLFFDKEGGFAGVFDPTKAIVSPSNIALVFICWFITNNDHTAKYWGMVTGSPIGAALDIVLSSATIAYVAKVATDAAKPAYVEGLGYIGYFAIAVPVLKATVVGSAGNFLPLDKGFSFENGLDEVAERAFTAAVYMNVASIMKFDYLDSIACFFGPAASHTYDAAFVVFATVVVHLTIGLCPQLTSPLATVQDKIFDITALNRN